MKKDKTLIYQLTSFILIIFLASGIATPALSEALPRDIPLDEAGWISSCAWWEGALYVLGDSGLYRFDPRAQGPEPLPVLDEQESAVAEGLSLSLLSSAENLLFTEGSGLYALRLTEEGAILPLSAEQGGIRLGEGLPADLSPLRGSQAAQLLGFGGRLYICTMNEQNTAAELISYDIAKGGTARRFPGALVWSLCPYRDGRLLALTAEPGRGGVRLTSGAQNFSLSVFDPETGALQSLGDSGLPLTPGTRLAYDEASDTVYLKGRDGIFRRGPDGGTERIARLIPSYTGKASGEGLFLIDGQELLAVQGGGIALRAADGEALSGGQLRIRGGIMNQTHELAMKALPELSVSFEGDERTLTAQPLAEALISGDDSFDILIVSSLLIDTGRLMDKGFLADLSQSKELRRHMSSLYPALQGAGSRGEGLYLIPIAMTPVGIMGYYPELFDEIGLAPPQSYDELADFVQRWNDELGDLYPDYLPLSGTDFTGQMIALALDMRMDQAAVSGQPFSYRDEALEAMLRRALALDTDNIAPRIDWQSPDAQEQAEPLHQKLPIIEMNHQLNLENLNLQLHSEKLGISLSVDVTEEITVESGPQYPLFLAQTEKETAPIRLNLLLMGINPRSKNVEAALRYVEAYIASMDALTLTMMSPDINAPIPNPRYEKDLEDLDTIRRHLEENLSKSQGAERTELEREYAEFTAKEGLLREEAPDCRQSPRFRPWTLSYKEPGSQSNQCIWG